jgi:hypothetical protein
LHIIGKHELHKDYEETICIAVNLVGTD